MGAIRTQDGSVICKTTRLRAWFPDNKDRAIWQAGMDITCGECAGTIPKDAYLSVNGNLMSQKTPIKLLCQTCRPFTITGESEL